MTRGELVSAICEVSSKERGLVFVAAQEEICPSGALDGETTASREETGEGE